MNNILQITAEKGNNSVCIKYSVFCSLSDNVSLLIILKNELFFMDNMNWCLSFDISRKYWPFDVNLYKLSMHTFSREKIIMGCTCGIVVTSKIIWRHMYFASKLYCLDNNVQNWNNLF